MSSRFLFFFSHSPESRRNSLARPPNADPYATHSPPVVPYSNPVKLNEALKSGRVGNGEYLRVYLKEDLPKRLHYVDSEHIPLVIGLVEEGFKVEQTRLKRQECGGSHGYDNAIFSMRSVFVGHRPRFGRGRKVPCFENVEIYNLVSSILNIDRALNNGTESFPSSVLCLAVEIISRCLCSV